MFSYLVVSLPFFLLLLFVVFLSSEDKLRSREKIDETSFLGGGSSSAGRLLIWGVGTRRHFY